MVPSPRSCSLSAAVIGAALLLVSPHAGAQQDVDTQVRALMRDGEEALAADRLEDAESAYDKAYALKPGFDVAANLADVERRRGKLAEAAEHYAFAIRNFPSSFDNKLKRQLQTALAEVQTELATVEVTVSKRGATVRLDGREVGTSPLEGPLFVRPGEHRLEAQLGEAVTTETLTLDAGTTTGLVLDPKGPAEPDPDDPFGPNDAETSLLGPIVLGTGAGVVLVGVVAGGVLTQLANDRASEAAAAPEGSEQRRDRQEAQEPLANGALWSFVGAGVGAIAAGVGAYLWLTDEPPREGAATESSIKIVPWTSQTTYGAGLVGRW